MDDKKILLVAKLEEELELLGNSAEAQDMKWAIKYLQTGQLPHGIDIEDTDMLYGAVEDLRGMYISYGIE